MIESNIVELFTGGKIIIPDKNIDVPKQPWYEHPAFRGVYLKDLVTAEDTKGAFSCHIVKVRKGCEVGEHYHGGEWEFNEILEGSGSFIIGGKNFASRPGFSYATPPGVPHVVSAPGEDIYLLAKFVPALK